MRRLCNGIFGIDLCIAIGRSGGVRCSAAIANPAAASDDGLKPAHPSAGQQPPAATDTSQQPQTQDQTATSDEDEHREGRQSPAPKRTSIPSGTVASARA